MEFKMILSIPIKNVTWILTGIALFVYQFGRTGIFIMLSLPIHDHGISHHYFTFALIYQCYSIFSASSTHILLNLLLSISFF